jgi:hypothetical protein
MPESDIPVTVAHAEWVAAPRRDVDDRTVRPPPHSTPIAYYHQKT